DGDERREREERDGKNSLGDGLALPLVLQGLAHLGGHGGGVNGERFIALGDGIVRAELDYGRRAAEDDDALGVFFRMNIGELALLEKSFQGLAGGASARFCRLSPQGPTY